MTEHTKTEIPFLPWTNDNGLVNGTMPNGRPTFDIYDASSQPVGGSETDETSQEIAAAMILAVNNHKALVEALTDLLDVAVQGKHGGPLTAVTFHYEDGDEDGYGPEPVAKARAVLS